MGRNPVFFGLPSLHRGQGLERNRVKVDDVDFQRALRDVKRAAGQGSTFYIKESIFNTHDVQLLNLDIFRRDQIYFVEKDNRTGASELYALSDFSPRKTEKIRKGYMLGRYGAIPDIGELEW